MSTLHRTVLHRATHLHVHVGVDRHVLALGNLELCVDRLFESLRAAGVNNNLQRCAAFSGMTRKSPNRIGTPPRFASNAFHFNCHIRVVSVTLRSACMPATHTVAKHSRGMVLTGFTACPPLHMLSDVHERDTDIYNTAVYIHLDATSHCLLPLFNRLNAQHTCADVGDTESVAGGMKNPGHNLPCQKAVREP